MNVCLLAQFELRVDLMALFDSEDPKDPKAVIFTELLDDFV